MTSGQKFVLWLGLINGVLMGLFPRPFLTTMEKSTQKFVSDMKAKIVECDGPPHRYGSMLPNTDGKCPSSGGVQAVQAQQQRHQDAQPGGDNPGHGQRLAAEADAPVLLDQVQRADAHARFQRSPTPSSARSRAHISQPRTA